MFSALFSLTQYNVFLSKVVCVHMGHSAVLGTITHEGLSKKWPVLKEQCLNSDNTDGC